MTIPFRAKQKESTTLPKQSTPRKGTETRAQAGQAPPAGETIYTPQGDGNCSAAMIVVPDPGNNLHPARGRKRFPVTRSWKLLETIYTPQGDGNELPCPYGNNCMRNNLHPARGRKRFLTDYDLLAPLETIYTPQGDGNSQRLQSTLYLPETIYTPQGDGNASDVRDFDIFWKQSTPRKGTETSPNVASRRRRKETIYTPQGDGNSTPSESAAFSAWKQSTPRKGTETRCTGA